MVEKVLCWFLHWSHTCATINEFSDLIHSSCLDFPEFLPLLSVCSREQHLRLLFGFRISSRPKQGIDFHIFIFIL